MRERLTKRDKDGNAVVFNYIKTAGEFKEIVDRLAEYEDAEEQGLIVRLPCKTEDEVYYIYEYEHAYYIRREIVSGYSYNKKYGWRLLLNTCEAMFSSIGNNVFLTRAEAEKKLKELIRFEKELEIEE